MSITTSARDALGAFRGTLVEPADAGYDAARAVYNAMIDRRPALIARAAGADDVARAVTPPASPACRSPSAAGATTAPAWARGRRDRPRPRRDARDRRRPARAHRARGRRLHLGRGRPRHPRARHGHAERDHQHDRRRRAHARRRPGAPDPPLRADGRQPAVRRGRPRRRHAGRRERRRAPGPVLGAARRRRQLRRGHVVRVPAPRRAHRRRRADVLAGRAGRGGALRLPGVPSRRPAGVQRVLRLPHGAAGRAVPRADPPAARCAASSGATPGSEAAAARDMQPLLDALPEPLLHGVQPMPHPVLQSAFDGLYPKGDQWYWRADFVARDPRRGRRAAPSAGARACRR